MPSLVNAREFVWPYCVCEVAEYEAEQAKLRAKQQADRLDRFFNTFKMPVRFQDRQIGNFKPVPGSKEAFDAVYRYVETITARLEQGAGFVLWGTNGNGKTHLAAAAFHAARATGSTAIFVCVPELLKRLKATFDDREGVSEQELTGPLLTADLLVLDDLGQEKASAWVLEKLFTVLNQRYESRRSVIVTTNRTPEQLEDRIGKAAFDRLMGMCRFFEVTAPSQRWDEAPGW